MPRLIIACNDCGHHAIYHHHSHGCDRTVEDKYGEQDACPCCEFKGAEE